jgi:group I intron endonuclease
VPIQKCFKFNNFKKYNLFKLVRSYSTLSSKSLKNKNIDYIKVYENAFDMRKNILNENKGKSGIYMITNKITKDIYIGQSKNISNRFKNYFNLSYIKSKDSYIINRALLKYGYSNFSLTILEYCDKSNLLVREQYYFDKLNPQYNILKIAGSSLNSKHLEESKVKFIKNLKRVSIKENSALFGRHHIEETKNLMSNKKVRENNPLFGKTHRESSIELMRQKALNREQSLNIKLKMSAIRGNPVNIYEKLSSEGFKLIGCFVSARRAAKFLGLSGSTIIKYKNSGKIYKDRYKFSSN